MTTYGKYAKKTAKFIGRGTYMAAKSLRKRYVKKRQPRMINIIKDVAMLKHLVNVEKKRYDVALTIQTMAQFAGPLSGAYCVNITPSPNEGVTGGTRIGLSIKLVSCCIDMQFKQQANTVNDLKLRWHIICRPDNSLTYSGTQIRDQFYETNPFSGVVDFWSNRDPEYLIIFKFLKVVSLT